MIDSTAKPVPEGSGDRERLRQHVDRLLGAGRVEEAATVLRRLVALDPDDGAAHLALGTLLAGHSRVGLAVIHLDRAVRLVPHDAAAALACGKARLHAGDPVGAAIMFRRTAVLAPALAEGHFQLGVAAHKHGRHDLALAAQALACQLQSAHAGAQFCRARALFLLGRDDEADAAFARAAALDAGLRREWGILRRTFRPADVRPTPGL